MEMECVPHVPPQFGRNGQTPIGPLEKWSAPYYKPLSPSTMLSVSPGIVDSTEHSQTPTKPIRSAVDLWQNVGTNGALGTQSLSGTPANSSSPTSELLSFGIGNACHGASSAFPYDSVTESRLTSDTASSPLRSRQSSKCESPSKSRKRKDSEACKQADKLEKNRRAAEKCRQKQRAREKCLQERARQEEVKRAGLVRQVTGLQGEILSLKERMVVHSGCEDAQGIRQYLMRDVNKWTAQRQGFACAYDEKPVQTDFTA